MQYIIDTNKDFSSKFYLNDEITKKIIKIIADEGMSTADAKYLFQFLALTIDKCSKINPDYPNFQYNQ